MKSKNWFALLLWIPCTPTPGICADADNVIPRGNLVTGTSSSAFAPVATLVPLAEAQGGKDGVFDFGEASLMDNTQKMADLEKSLAIRPVLPGLKHTFVLQNRQSFPVTIKRLQPDCVCGAAEIVDDNRVVDTPYTVVPGGNVSVRMAVDYYLLAPGSASTKIAVIGESDTKPLATLEMRGAIKGGIEFSDRIVDFGQLKPGHEMSRRIGITFDRRFPSREAVRPAPVYMYAFRAAWLRSDPMPANLSTRLLGKPRLWPLYKWHIGLVQVVWVVPIYCFPLMSFTYDTIDITPSLHIGTMFHRNSVNNNVPVAGKTFLTHNLFNYGSSCKFLVFVEEDIGYISVS